MSGIRCRIMSSCFIRSPYPYLYEMFERLFNHNGISDML